MFGMPSPLAGAAPPAAAEPPAPSAPAAQAPAPATPVAPSPTAGKSRARTMLGMAAVPLPASAPTPAAAQPVAPVAAAPSAAPSTPAGPAAVTNRTMLGVAVAPPSAAPAAQAHAAPSTPAGPAAVTNRTMLGMPARGTAAAPAAAAPSSHPPRRRAAVSEGTPLTDLDSIPGLGRRRRLWPFVVGLFLLGFAAITTVLALYVLNRGPDVRASVVQTDEGERLRVEVPAAVAGTHVRVAGQEAALTSGAADLPLAADALHLGDNRLSVDVVQPGGDVREAEVVLFVSYRVRPDLTGLAADTPHLSVVVDAAPGSSVTLEGQPLALDAQGHGVRDFPLDGAAQVARVERTFRYRVVPAEGSPADGEVHVALPYAQLEVDRPGLRLVTDRENVELAGLVAAGATLTLDGVSVEVREGRFLETLALTELGEHTFVLLARQPGHAPKRVAIRVRRVQDMIAEARGYELDPDLNYERIAQNPDIYRGRHVAFEGRVYNVHVEAGRSDLQLLVRHCAAGHRCPLWVSYPAATDAALDDWVRVLGEVAGEQQFRAESGEIMHVPKLEAVYVLPAAP